MRVGGREEAFDLVWAGIYTPPPTPTPTPTPAPRTQAVYVADVRHNAWRSVPAEVLRLNGLVVLNASDNDIESLADGAEGRRGAGGGGRCRGWGYGVVGSCARAQWNRGVARWYREVQRGRQQT